MLHHFCLVQNMFVLIILDAPAKCSKVVIGSSIFIIAEVHNAQLLGEKYHGRN